MNNYCLSDLKIGWTEQFHVRITEKMMDSFREITGDINPLHNDEEYALKQGFPSKVGYGMLTASFLSTLAGVYLPGKRSMVYSVNIGMTKPVFVGDELVITGKVMDIYESVSQIDVKVEIKKMDGEKVLKGNMRIVVRDE